MQKSFKKGFTLLEILLVVGIIAILAGIVIVAINPSKQLATVRNTERKSDIKQIDSAILQYYIDHFHYPVGITANSTEVCDTGAVATTTVAVDQTPCGDLVNLSDLVPLYITAVPKDPRATSTGNGTGYYLSRNATTQKLGVSAELAELGQVIVIGTTTSGVVTPPAATYTITYNGNTNTGGSVPADQTKTEDETLVLRTNSGTLLKTGYTFAGWNTAANGSGTTYAVGADYTANAAATMYAKWTAVVVDACGTPGDATDPDCWSDEETGLAWGPTEFNVPGVSESETAEDGKANTAALYALGSSYVAAYDCYTLTEDSVSVGTWYLPSYAELWAGYNAPAMSGGFPSDYYWSSTEFSVPVFVAWVLKSGSGIMSGNVKDGRYSVRCLR